MIDLFLFGINGLIDTPRVCVNIAGAFSLRVFSLFAVLITWVGCLYGGVCVWGRAFVTPILLAFVRIPVIPVICICPFIFPFAFPVIVVAQALIRWISARVFPAGSAPFALLPACGLPLFSDPHRWMGRPRTSDAPFRGREFRAPPPPPAPCCCRWLVAVAGFHMYAKWKFDHSTRRVDSVFSAILRNIIFLGGRGMWARL